MREPAGGRKRASRRGDGGLFSGLVVAAFRDGRRWPVSWDDLDVHASPRLAALVRSALLVPRLFELAR